MWNARRMTSFASALAVVGSAGSCSTTSTMTGCVGAPPMPLRPAVIAKMDRSELKAYVTYKTWWQTYCKNQF